jgi:heme exporter protein D
MWNSPTEFFAMGGYALYVWCSFGICAFVFLMEPLAIRIRHKTIVRRLQREVMAEQLDQKGSK